MSRSLTNDAPSPTELVQALPPLEALELSTIPLTELTASASMGALGAACLLIWLIARKLAAGLSDKAAQWCYLSALSMMLAMGGWAITQQWHLGLSVEVAGGIALVGAALSWPLWRMMGLTFVKPREKVDKGAKLASVTEVANLVKKVGPARIALGGVPIPKKSEPVHFMIQGGTGSGKSVAINRILHRTTKDGDQIIVLDSGGDFASRLYDPTRDVILNPFDARSCAWNPLTEMRTPYDALELAKSIVPPGEGESKEWNEYAQNFVAACLTVLHREEQRSIEALMYLVQDATMAELAQRLAGTAAAAQLTSEKTFGSIRVIATNYMTAYSFLPPPTPTRPAFSVREFVERGRPGTLFITYRDDQLATLQSLMACVLDVTSRAVLSLEPSDTRRVWLIIDEFASLSRIQSIESFAAKARKYGGCLVIGLQSVAQLFERYGERAAQGLMSNLGTWLVLRCSDPDTAEYMSRFMGDQQIVRHTESQNRGARAGGNDSFSVNEQVVIQRVVMGSVLQELPALNGYLRVAGGVPVCKVVLPTKGLAPIRGVGFEPRVYEDQAPSASPSPTPPRAPVPPVAMPVTMPVTMAPGVEPVTQPVGPMPTADELLAMLQQGGGATEQFLLEVLTGRG